MLYIYKGFGLVKSCNYSSPSKWVITSTGSTVASAWTLAEAKQKINNIISIRKERKK